MQDLEPRVGNRLILVSPLHGIRPQKTDFFLLPHRHQKGMSGPGGKEKDDRMGTKKKRKDHRHPGAGQRSHKDVRNSNHDIEYDAVNQFRAKHEHVPQDIRVHQFPDVSEKVQDEGEEHPHRKDGRHDDKYGMDKLDRRL